VSLADRVGGRLRSALRRSLALWAHQPLLLHDPLGLPSPGAKRSASQTCIRYPRHRRGLRMSLADRVGDRLRSALRRSLALWAHQPLLLHDPLGLPSPGAKRSASQTCIRYPRHQHGQRRQQRGQLGQQRRSEARASLGGVSPRAATDSQPWPRSPNHQLQSGTDRRIRARSHCNHN
jgi:hypothetical protein